MKLVQLYQNIDPAIADTEITAITDDNRKIVKDCIFVCVKGERFDGHTVAAQALEQGAAVVVTERDLGLGERQILVEDSRACYGELCAAWFDHPERKMRFIGVTGTNGKTTITTVIKHILTANGHKVGLIGTIQNEIGDEIVPTNNTTPLTFELMALYDRMYKSGCDVVVMEVSSFGLVQKRIGTTHFDAAVFTNLTQDHLDYHKTMEAYYQAKRMLFDICDTALINTEDDYGKRLYAVLDCKKYSIGKERADYTYTTERVTASGSAFTLAAPDGTHHIQMHMTGGFNVANASAAYAACAALGLIDAQILPHL